MNEFQLQKLLRKHAGITEAQLADLNHEAVKTDTTLEQVAVRQGVVTRERLYELLSRELGLPYIDLSNYLVQNDLIQLVPSELARQLQVIPLFQVGGALTVATSRPDDIGAIDQLRQALKLEINTVLADPEALAQAVRLHYGHAENQDVHDAVVELEADEALRYIESEQAAKSVEQLAGEAPVIRFVNTVIEQAVEDRASDIHFEPDQDRLGIRVRVDGIMHRAGDFPLRLHAAVSSRLKLLAGMDISDRRRPQDGRFEVRAGNRMLDVRASAFPTVYGENVVLRLLDKTGGGLRLAQLGFDDTVRRRFETVIHQPHGIVLVTGPTGSGKTTTLYAVLNELNSEERNILTLEDPVEYRLPMIRQCQVNVKAGITFASGLRSILRQDPDVIMVGEVRDAETAEVAFQAALTGHVVLSTLHTNDAAGALTRMIDMGVEPFLISSSVLAVVAQRLVRRNCDRCAAPYSPAPEVLERLGLADTGPGVTFRRGTGCPACGRRGYRGRLGVYELMPMSQRIRRMVMDRRSSEEIKSQAVSDGMQTLRDDGLAKALSGATTAEEVLRVSADRALDI
jgi:type IV pilus assembly protein PilB